MRNHLIPFDSHPRSTIGWCSHRKPKKWQSLKTRHSERVWTVIQHVGCWTVYSKEKNKRSQTVFAYVCLIHFRFCLPFSVFSMESGQDSFGFGARNVNLAVSVVLGLVFCSRSPLVSLCLGPSKLALSWLMMAPLKTWARQLEWHNFLSLTFLFPWTRQRILILASRKVTQLCQIEAGNVWPHLGADDLWLFDDFRRS